MTGQYNRSFITLKQERADFAFNGRKGIGSAIVERRGNNAKVSVTVYNMKPKVLYKVYLIYSKDGTVWGINAGSLNVDERGNGQLKQDFSAANVGDCGIPIEEFNVVAVIVPKKNELVVPLEGYRNEAVMWKNNFVEYTKKQGSVVITEEKIQPKPVKEELKPLSKMEEEEVPVEAAEESLQEEPPIEAAEETQQEEKPIEALAEMPEEEIPIEIAEEAPEEQSPTIEVAEECQKEEIPIGATEKFTDMDIHEEFKAMAEKFNKELKELTQYTFLTEEELASIHNKYEKEIPNEADEPKTKLDMIFSEYASLTPFQRQNKEVSWIRISPQELCLLPFDFSIYQNNPMILSAYNKYQHLILGRVGGLPEKCMEYILGVPEQYKAEHRLAALKMGFGQFKCCEDAKPKEGDYGYWLMRIEVK